MALPVPGAIRGGNPFETMLSALVIAVAVAFGGDFFQKTGTGHLGSYTIHVSLPNAEGLDVGNDVRVSGAKVGSVRSLDVDSHGYRAMVDVSIRDDLALPSDTTARVNVSALGEVHLTLEPGSLRQMVKPGGTIGAPPPPARPVRSRAES